MKRDAVLNVRLEGDIKEALRRAAEADFGRSVSGMVGRILREWLLREGYLAQGSTAGPATVDAAALTESKSRRKPTRKG